MVAARFARRVPAPRAQPGGCAAARHAAVPARSRRPAAGGIVRLKLTPATPTFRPESLTYTRTSSHFVAAAPGAQPQEDCHGSRKASIAVFRRASSRAWRAAAGVAVLGSRGVRLHDVEGRRDAPGRLADPGQRVDRPAEEAAARRRRHRGRIPRLRPGAPRRRAGPSREGTERAVAQGCAHAVQDLRRAGIHRRAVSVVRAEHGSGQCGWLARAAAAAWRHRAAAGNRRPLRRLGRRQHPQDRRRRQRRMRRRVRAAAAVSASAGGRRSRATSRRSGTCRTRARSARSAPTSPALPC